MAKDTKKKAAAPKAGKKEKDPNAPKRGLSAYMFFSQAKRKEVADKNPEYKMGDIAKELGAMWKTISDKDKAKYEDMAKKDKERYEKAKAEYEGK
ncbi:MAG: high mobility group box domain-containing protein [Monoraphidium minutum]|nr:MAG: high mobility group box domain-containing protein [Monoraphidium minutum]